MCGRFACSLDPQTICRACQYRRSDGKTSEPKWIDNPSIPQFQPSSNVAPTNYSPVLLSGRQLSKEGANAEDRVVMPMRFGLIPFWHKGEESSLRMTTINARVEGIQTAKTYSNPLKKGQRCVVLAEGFYEWEKKNDKTKQPYLIYLPENQEQFQKTEDILAENVHLLKLAAVYDIWQPQNAAPVYSYSIITTESAKSLKWVHNRMPAVLRTEADVDVWLDTEKVTPAQAISILHPVDDLVFHPVVRAMGNVAYKNPDAVKPIRMNEADTNGMQLPKGQKTMDAFLTSPGKGVNLELESSTSSHSKTQTSIDSFLKSPAKRDAKQADISTERSPSKIKKM